MSEQNKLPEEEQVERFTLTDEEGNEIEFELIGSGEVDGVMYYAMIPAEEAADENRDTFEYVILKSEVDENGDESLFTIDDDEEFDRVADFFDDMFSTVDFDAEDCSFRKNSCLDAFLARLRYIFAGFLTMLVSS